MRQQTPTEALTEWLGRKIAAAAPGTWLPADRELARRFGLSSRTVARIMGGLAAEGKLVRVQGKGTSIPGGAPQVEMECGPMRTSAEALAEQITEALVHGEMKQGEALPSVKFMARRFKVSQDTVIKAYRILQKKGEIVKIGKTFWIGAFADLIHPQARREVFLFLNDHEDLRQVFLGNQLAISYRRMEDILASSGYLLRYEYIGNFAALAARWTRERAIPFGAVFYNFDPTRLEQVKPVLDSLNAAASGARFPVLIEWSWGIFNNFSRNTFLLCHPNLATIMARTLARHLVSRKFKSAVFFAERACLANNPHSGWAQFDLMRCRAELKHLDPSFSYCLAIAGPADTYDPALIFSEVPREHIDRVLRKFHPATFDDLLPEITACERLEQAFDRGARAEVWVFQRDWMAAAALEWARQRRLAVPEKLSIISFENEPEFCHLGLSRCEPDWESTGYLMAHVIMGDIPIEKTSKGFMRTRARVVEKLTTK